MNLKQKQREPMLFCDKYTVTVVDFHIKHNKVSTVIHENQMLQTALQLRFSFVYSWLHTMSLSRHP